MVGLIMGRVTWVNFFQALAPSMSMDSKSSVGTPATAGSSKYALAADVMVLLRDSGQQGYYPTTLSAVNSTDYSLVGWYDNQGASAGGRIRILVATKK